MNEIDTRLAAIAERFVAQAPEIAEGLKTSLQGASWKELSRQSHSLAGRAGMFGFTTIGAAAGAVEQAIESGADTLEITQMTERLLHLLTQLKPA